VVVQPHAAAGGVDGMAEEILFEKLIERSTHAVTRRATG
jgi:hypothetical protein